jgi:alkyl hydroperoxide reductase subunit AhpC
MFPGFSVKEIFAFLSNYKGFKKYNGVNVDDVFKTKKWCDTKTSVKLKKFGEY